MTFMFCIFHVDVLQKMFNILLLSKSVVYRLVLAFTLWLNGYMCINFIIFKIDFAVPFRFGLLGANKNTTEIKLCLNEFALKIYSNSRMSWNGCIYAWLDVYCIGYRPITRIDRDIKISYEACLLKNERENLVCLKNIAFHPEKQFKCCWYLLSRTLSQDCRHNFIDMCFYLF